MRSLLRRNRAYRNLAAASTISGVGDWMFGLAVAVWVLDRTGSPAWVAASVVCRIAPFAFFGVLGGAIADRFDRRRVLITFDLTRAVLVALLVLVVAGHGPVVVGIGIATAIGLAGTPYRPAIVAVTPAVVAGEDLADANAIEAGIFQVLMFAGPALASLLLQYFSVAGVFAIDGATFVISALLVARLPHGNGTRAECVTDEPETTGCGLAVVRRTPGIAALVGLLTTTTFAFGVTMVALVLLVEDLGAPAAHAGYLTAIGAVAGLGATVVARRIPGHGAARALVASAVMMGAVLVALPLAGSVALACVVMIPDGIGTVLLEVVSTTALQRTVPGDRLGRVFGVVDAFGGAGQMAGAFAAPLLIALLGLGGTLATTGLAVIVVAAMSVRRLAPLDEPAPATRARRASRTPVAAST